MVKYYKIPFSILDSFCFSQYLQARWLRYRFMGCVPPLPVFLRVLGWSFIRSLEESFIGARTHSIPTPYTSQAPLTMK